jgi:hypothetical protein
VAHALVRAASRLISTPRDPKMTPEIIQYRSAIKA